MVRAGQREKEAALTVPLEWCLHLGPFLYTGCVCMKYCHTLKEDEQETDRCTTTSQAVLYGVFADTVRTGNS
jgi:hypothetical protein